MPADEKPTVERREGLSWKIPTLMGIIPIGTIPPGTVITQDNIIDFINYGTAIFEQNDATLYTVPTAAELIEQDRQDRVRQELENRLNYNYPPGMSNAAIDHQVNINREIRAVLDQLPDILSTAPPTGALVGQHSSIDAMTVATQRLSDMLRENQIISNPIPMPPSLVGDTWATTIPNGITQFRPSPITRDTFAVYCPDQETFDAVLRFRDEFVIGRTMPTSLAGVKKRGVILRKEPSE